ncbi:MAG: hypothetical protein ACOC93_04605, partial [Planctomycetota bacterium]
MMRFCFAVAASVLALLTISTQAEPVQRTIPNALKLSWPGDLVHFDLPANAAEGPLTAEVAGGEPVPVQIERVEKDGKRVPRAWLVAKVPGEKQVEVTFRPGPAESPLRIEQTDDWLVVHNGISEMKLPRYRGELDEPTPISELRPPIGPVRVAGEDSWYGRSWFNGTLPIRQVRTEVLAAGPVFVKVRLTYDAGLPSGGGEDVKLTDELTGYGQTEPTWKWLNDRNGVYETTLTFVANDPWVQVEERYTLGGRANIPGGAETASYHMELAERLQPDTAMWIRWFEYGQFGGNTDMNFVPTQPRPKQNGPFVKLQPRWTQSPGGGQDFFVTSGGEDGDPNTPAVGFVATHPTRWFLPYQQIISAHAEGGDSARVDLPLTWGGRAYAVCVGPRKLFDSTGKLNDLVRRHVDWTLDDQVHDYILDWQRDPSKAGPHILVTRERIEQLRSDWEAGKDTPTMDLLGEYVQTYRKMQEGDVAKNERIGGEELDLLKLILDEDVGQKNPPTAQLWIGRRYQDDFLNPTTYTRTVKDGLPKADLYAGGEPIGGPGTAALGYVFSDLDHWPGTVNGWSVGNPNFHTDKYMVALFTGAAMLDHPHAEDWIDFGRRNFRDDLDSVLLAPDGVGYECPGYSTYSLGLQFEIAQVFVNVGEGNPVAANPLFKETGRWHRKLLTPRDERFGLRHQAPIGDTHRWGGKDGKMFGRLGTFHTDADPAFAREMMGIWKLFVDQGMHVGLMDGLIEVDQSIEPMPLEEMDWSSEAFEGFGTVFRSRFQTPRETFVSFKAGRAHGHYHNDDLSYHFYGAGEPVSLDYNCSYSPRGDHAALHNSMTFGRTKSFTHTGEDEAVEAMEQIGGRGKVLATSLTDTADVVVAERSSERLELRPWDPRNAKFHYPYPSRQVDPITHRRTLALVKHPEDSQMQDYLVVRDETI